MRVVLGLTRGEAEAMLRAELSVGYGVRRSNALTAGAAKLRAALTRALCEPSPTQSTSGTEDA